MEKIWELNRLKERIPKLLGMGKITQFNYQLAVMLIEFLTLVLKGEPYIKIFEEVKKCIENNSIKVTIKNEKL